MADHRPPADRRERAAVGKLSSHIEVSATHAWVDYDWGDFKHDPEQVLARYFDAFLYFANWGQAVADVSAAQAPDRCRTHAALRKDRMCGAESLPATTTS